MRDCSRRKFLGAAVLLLAAIGSARAEGIEAQKIDVVQRGEFFLLSGSFVIQLSPELDGALRRGVQLSFVQAVQAERERDWWLAEGLSDLDRSVRLSYNALLRQYRVNVGGVTSEHESLSDALHDVGDLRDWAVVNVRQMKKKSEYKIYVRLYLDVSQLPKPLQVNALASSGRWQLDSGWQERVFKY